jgi:xeroderma pigmentosum group C-complementing protein
MPVYYLAEIHMQGHEKWLIVDPISGFVGFQVEKAKVIHAEAISYVVAFESKFGCKDVTPRYTVSWGNTAVRTRIPERPDEMGWWSMTLWLYSKSDLSDQDIEDDAALQQAEAAEKLPTSFAGFQNHPLYALERHLKQNEAIYPLGKEHAIGVYKNEMVYSRKQVQRVRLLTSWHQQKHGSGKADVSEKERLNASLFHLPNEQG